MSYFIPTSSEDWSKSDAYFNSFLIPADPVLDAAVQNAKANDLPNIEVSAAQGKFLNLLAQTMKAKRILEIGALGGYSTIWLARSLPEDGKLITLEVSEKHAAVAGENIKNAGLSSKVDIKVGAAADTLQTLKTDEPFDLVFIDADWTGIPTYFNFAKKLTRPGSVIIIDNINWLGKVALEPKGTKEYGVEDIRKLLESLKGDKEVEATTLGVAGVKGFDGILYAVKL